jgi:DNA topoisomerase I
VLTRIDEARIDPADAARVAGLRYVCDENPGIRRRRSGKGFRYLEPDGAALSDARALWRIRSLAVPPAWTDVWICPSADGHIQATGRDARRRKQYRYHSLFREFRDSNKYAHVVAFAEVLPAIRTAVRAAMAQRGLPREKVLATVVHLLDTTLIRVGNGDYARHNKSYGLTTLKNNHASVDGSEVRFRFTGKGGKQWSVRLRDRRVAKIIRACQELPGQDLLQYVDDDGQAQRITSNDVNAYLRELTGQDITAKDFRTWAGSVLAAQALKDVPGFRSQAQAKRQIRAAVECVAKRLGNTVAICRKCYVHPELIDAYLDRSLAARMSAPRAGISRRVRRELHPEELELLRLLRPRRAGNGRAARGRPSTGNNWGAPRLDKHHRGRVRDGIRCTHTQSSGSRVQKAGG